MSLGTRSWSHNIVKEQRYTLPDGREVIVKRTFNDLLQDGQVIERILIDRQLIGDITENEALDFAQRIGWVS